MEPHWATKVQGSLGTPDMILRQRRDGSDLQGDLV